MQARCDNKTDEAKADIDVEFSSSTQQRQSLRQELAAARDELAKATETLEALRPGAQLTVHQLASPSAGHATVGRTKGPSSRLPPADHSTTDDVAELRQELAHASAGNAEAFNWDAHAQAQERTQRSALLFSIRSSPPPRSPRDGTHPADCCCHAAGISCWVHCALFAVWWWLEMFLVVQMRAVLEVLRQG